MPLQPPVAILVVPAALILLHGIGVTVLRWVEAPTTAYFALISVLALFLIALAASRTHLSGNRQRQLYLFMLIGFAAGATGLHQIFYGTAVGSDGAYYFSHPFHSFYAGTPLSFSEAPFVTFGIQPLATYWIPYTGEYGWAALGSLIGADFDTVSALAQLASNFLLFFALAVLLLQYTPPLPALACFLLCLALMYGVDFQRQNLAGMSLFRGSENKGLIFGYYYWACLALMLPSTRDEGGTSLRVVPAVILAASAFFISGNFAVLGLLALVLGAGGAFAGRWREVTLPAFAFIAATIVAIVAYKSLETTDVYRVVTADLEPRAPETYLDQWRIYGHPWWLWLIAIVSACAAVVRTPALGVSLVSFSLASILLHSETAYDLLASAAPERALIIWRVGILFNPYVPIAVGLAAFLNSVGPLTVRYAATGLVAGAAALIAIAAPPPPSARLSAKAPEVLKQVARHCEVEEAAILADRDRGTFAAVVMPSAQILAGKSYFLNWQIANLAEGSHERQLATQVRDAGLFLSGESSNPEGLRATLREMSPDIVIIRKKLARTATWPEAAAYESASHGDFAIWSKPGRCAF